MKSMKKISLLHTVRTVYESFAENLREVMPGVELEIMNTVDEFLAADANINGFTQENKNRMLHILQAKDLERADIIVVTCSTLTPVTEEIRPLLKTPLVAIDDEMAELAVRAGERIVLMATAASTLEPGTRKLHTEAAKIGRELKLERVHCPAAYDAIRQMDRETHDKILLEAAKSIKDADAIVLAQASMAHMEKNIEAVSGIKTFSSPRLCFERIKRMLGV